MTTATAPLFEFDNSYARELEGFYQPWQGDVAPAPRVIMFNTGLAAEMGLPAAGLNNETGAAILAGGVAPAGAMPLAQAYAGHQFGGFSPQLGDGRALLLGEVIDRAGARRDIHLKGSGRTPFSRGGDGKAVLGPVLREYLMGEAMHALGVPTTRALAAVSTGEIIAREGPKPGAVLTRVAASHLRVGTFQFFAARGETARVRQLAEYAIARHDPDLIGTADRYLAFLDRVAGRQAHLIAKWMQIGFIHGVMNTDNMTISGETIDYGPCAFMDAYHPRTVFSSIDTQGRYAYANQPIIAQWNLARLAETFLPLIDPEDTDNAIRIATELITAFPARYAAIWAEGMRSKIGLTTSAAGDEALIADMLALLEAGREVDFTSFFRRLADAAEGSDAGLRALFADPAAPSAWLERWHARCEAEDTPPAARAAAMRRVNPLYIPRNHLVDAALNAAEGAGDMTAFTALLDVLANPFDHRAGLEAYEGPAPADFGPFQTFCGT